MAGGNTAEWRVNRLRSGPKLRRKVKFAETSGGELLLAEPSLLVSAKCPPRSVTHRAILEVGTQTD